MRKKVLLAALSALALAACVNDETIEMNPGNAVAFRPSTENSTRATVTTSNTIQDFKVWGYYKKNDNADYTSFMEEQVVNKAGDEWVYSPVRFWPTTGEVDFYSVSPADVTTNITKDAQQILDYTVNTDPSKQIDLLYAANMECTNSNSSKGVPVNFRHALSQVVFKAKTINPNIQVDIESISLWVMGKGTFTFPKKTTTAINKSNTYEDAAEEERFGKWTPSTAYEDMKSYSTNLAAPITVPTNGTAVNVTSTDNSTALLLLPQVLAANNVTVPGYDQPMPVAPTMSISCRIYNVSGEDKVQVWGWNDGFRDINNIPFEGTWQQGRKYTYTLIFGEEMRNFEKVNFTTSVDEFQSPLNENTNIQDPLEGIDMNQNEVYGGGNCFVIPKSDTETIRYYFDPTKEGQTNDPIGTTVTPIDHARKAMLMDENTEGMLTDIAYYSEEQKIGFNIEKGKTGNAIVAITDGLDNVLWSWHIWVVDDNTFMTETKQGEFMDRNLGAISKATADGNHNDWGVFYQYGRHTPALVYSTGSYGLYVSDYAEVLPISHKFVKNNASNRYWIGTLYDDKADELWSEANQARYSPAPKGWKLASTQELTTYFENAKRNGKFKVVKEGVNIRHTIVEGDNDEADQVFYAPKYIMPNGNMTSSAHPIFYYGASEHGDQHSIFINEAGSATIEHYNSRGHNLRLIKE